MKYLKYGGLTLFFVLIVVSFVRTRPTDDQRRAVTAATEEVLELYNREELSEITSMLVAYPGYSTPSQLDRRRLTTHETLVLVRRGAGRCPSTTTENRVTSLADQVKVTVLVACENAKVVLSLSWGTLNNRLVLANLGIAGDPIGSIPGLSRYIRERTRAMRESDNNLPSGRQGTEPE